MSVISYLLLQDYCCLFTLTDSLVMQQEHQSVNNADALQFANKIKVRKEDSEKAFDEFYTNDLLVKFIHTA
jgi:hypothetical protein